MKKIDLRLVVTDEKGKDNILSLFVPIAEGQEKKELFQKISPIPIIINDCFILKINHLLLLIVLQIMSMVCIMACIYMGGIWFQHE